MGGTIRYLNTDLELSSAEELTALAAAFEGRGAFPLHVTRDEDGSWHTSLETERQHREAGPNIAEMVAVAESLEEPHRTAWLRCTRRAFDVGYECGDGPWAFQHTLSGDLLGRMAALGASLQVTLYPAETPTDVADFHRVAAVDTERMTLRPLQAADRAEFVRIHELSRTSFQRWMPFLPGDTSVDEVFDVNLARTERGLREGDELRLVGVLADGRVVGVFSLSHITRESWQNAHANWRVSVDQMGKGLGTEGAHALLDLAFAPPPLGLGLHRVQADIVPTNRASLRVAEKAGFRLEGRARAYAEVNGVWEDHLLLARTADEHELRYLKGV